MPDGLQRLLAGVMAVATAPLVGVLALAVWLDSGGAPFYIAERNGEGARRFRLFKLRSMRVGAAMTGPGISLARDTRVTRLGRVLRRYRLDELPQLWNVVRGDMLLVGPRPEDPRFVDLTDALHRRVFIAKPGITGPTQLAFYDEAELHDEVDPEGHYRRVTLPSKLALDTRYLARRSVLLDCWILLQTVLTAMGRPPSRAAIEHRVGGSYGAADGEGDA